MKKKDRQRIKKASKLLVSALMVGTLSVPAIAVDVTDWYGFQEAVKGSATTINVKSNITYGSNALDDYKVQRNLSIIGDTTSRYIDGGNERNGLFLNFDTVSSIKISMQNFKSNGGIYLGGAITNAGTISTINGSFYHNYGSQGGAIYSGSEINNIEGSFRENSSKYEGGAIYNVLSIDNLTASFYNNCSYGNGGAIYSNYETTIATSTSNRNLVFEGNYINLVGEPGNSSVGGAIYNNEDLNLFAKDKDDTITFVGGETTASKKDIDSVHNDGTMNINGDAHNKYEGTVNFYTVGGGGKTNIYGGKVTTSKTFAQSNLTIAKDAIFETNANNLNITNAIKNSGSLSLTGGTLTQAITGNGSTVINGSVISNIGIGQNIIINAGKGLTADANLIGSDVTNNGTLTLTGDMTSTGILSKQITGGTVNIDGSIRAQALITSDILGGILEISADNIGGTYTMGGLSLLSGTLNGEVIGGHGIATIKSGETVTINNNIQPSRITIDMNAKLIANNADYIKSNDVKNHDGEFILKSGTLAIEEVNDSGKTIIDGIVESTASIVNTGGLTILSAADSTSGTASQLTTDAKNVGVDVTNGGILNLTGDDTTGVLSKAITGAGTTNIKGAVTSTASIANAINIDSGKSLTISANNVKGVVTNAGTLNLGTGTLSSAISGSSTIITTGDVSSIASYLGNDVTNTGHTLTLTGDMTGDAPTGALSKSISGTGTTVIDGIVTANAITQGALSINADKTLTASADNLSISNSFTNNGTLVTYGDLNYLTRLTSTTNTGTVQIKSGETLYVTGTKNLGGTLDLNGQTLNMQEGEGITPEYSTLTVNTLKGTGNLLIDAALTQQKADNIVYSAIDNAVVNLTSVNVREGFATRTTEAKDNWLTILTNNSTGTNAEFKIKGSAEGSTSTQFGDYLYTFEKGTNYGTLKVTEEYNPNITLADYIQGNVTERIDEYDFADNENLVSSITTSKNTDYNNPYTVGMNGKNLTGNGNGGITVANGKTLTINGKSGDSTNGTISNFATALTNKGTLAINNVNFEGNSGSTGGAISNTGAITNITGTFDSNSATVTGGSFVAAYGGAIYNNGGTISSIIGLTVGENQVAFNSNSVTVTGGSIINAHGGALYNYNGEIGSIAGDIKSNSVTATGTSLSSALGGAIYNMSGTINSITGDIKSNSATGTNTAQGGAIYNDGATISRITGDFISNSATAVDDGGIAQGGAIYNKGEITIATSSDHTAIEFSDNYVNGSNVQGGAIFNASSSTVALNAVGETDTITFVGGVDGTGVKKDIDGIYNEGTLNINGNATTTYAGTVNLYTVDGDGTTNINGGNVNVAKDFTQNAVTVASGATLTTNGNVTTTDGIANAETLNLLGGTSATSRAIINSTVSGDGTTNFGTADSKAYIQTTTDKAIAQTINLVNADVIANSALGASGKGFNISDTSTLTIAANNIKADVANSGTLNLGAGTLAQAITGSGSIITTGNVSSLANYLGNAVTNTTGNTLTLTGDSTTGQLSKAISGGNVVIDGTINSSSAITSAIEINGSNSLSIDADKVGGAVTNAAGTLNLGAGTLAQTISGNGTTNIKGDVTSTASIANAINIENGKSLTIGADNVDGAVTNAGILNLGAGTLAQAITGDGTIITTGNVSSLANYLGNAVTITTGKVLTLTGDSTTGALSKSISGGNVIIDGTINSTASIESTIGINSEKSLTSSADNIRDDVINRGTLILYADTLSEAEVVNDIDNFGTLKINGDGTITPYTGTVNLYNVTDYDEQKGRIDIYGGTVKIADAGSITQEDLLIYSGATLESNADNLHISDPIINMGTLNLFGGENIHDVIIRAMVNSDVTNAAGTTNFGNGVDDAYIQVNNDIAQAINIKANADVLANDTMGFSGKDFTIAEYGKLTIDAGNIKADVTNNGTLNLGAGTLAQAITGDGSIITTGDVSSIASYLGNDVTNTGHTLTLTGDMTGDAPTGVLSKVITGTGTTVIDGIVTANAITQGALSINSDKTLTASADNLNISTSLTNDGTLVTHGNLNNLSTLTNNGTVQIATGKELNVTNNYELDGGTLDLNNATLNMQEDEGITPEYSTLTVNTLKGAGNLLIDAALGATPESDKIVYSAVENAVINLTNVNVREGFASHTLDTKDDYLTVLVNNGTGSNATFKVNGDTGKTTTQFGNYYRYTFEKGTTEGTLKVTEEVTVPVSLTDYITANETGRLIDTYSFADNEILTEGITTGEAKDIYTIGMNGKNLTGNGNSGITISNGKSLTINGKTGDSGNGTISNFATALTNNGTLTLNDVIFKNNSAADDGGAIENNKTITSITGTFDSNSIFTENHSSWSRVILTGGALYNYGFDSKIESITGNFNSNYALANGDYESAASGGAIFNGFHSEIESILGCFTGNYAKAENASSTTARGGAIYNGSTIGSITADFNSNYALATSGKAKAMGGAIYNNDDGNAGTIGRITGDFIGNYASGATAQGGAIYNLKNITIATSTDHTAIEFRDNYVNGTTAQGGAIFNASSSTVALNAVGETDTITFVGGVDGTGVKKDIDGIYNNGTLNINDNSSAGKVSFYNVNGTGRTNIKAGIAEVQANAVFNQGTLNNQGIFNFNGTTGQVTTLSDNTTAAKGTTNINAGSFTVTGNATQKAININNDATLIASADNLSISDSFTNNGTLVTYGNLNHLTTLNNTNGTVQIATGKTLNITNNYGLDGTLDLNGLNLTGGGSNGGITISSGKSLTINGKTGEGANGTISNFATALINEGTLTLNNVNFSGNTTDVSNAGTLNLSGENTFGSVITGAGTTNINGGTVNALANITQSAVNLNDGTLQLGSKLDEIAAPTVNNLNVLGGTLSTLNGELDTVAIKSVGGDSAVIASIKFDVDLANKTGDYNNSDTFNITTFVDGSKLQFDDGDVNFISDMDSAYGKIKLADKNIGTGAKPVNSNIVGSQYKYLFKASNSDGSIDILRGLKNGLREYLHTATSTSDTYTMTEDDYMLQNIGTMEVPKLTVDGTTNNHYGIIGNDFSGVYVGNEKTLTIKNVGELNPDGSVKSSINGFVGSGGSFIVVQSGGTVNIENSVISSNTVSKSNAWGGAIFNMSNATLNVTDSVFIDNQAVNGSNGSGGAIYNYSNATANILAKDNGVIFRGNISGDGTSGAIYNAGTLGLYAKEGKAITFEGTKGGVASSTADTIFNSGTININGSFESVDYKGTINLVGVTGENGTININGGKVNANAKVTQKDMSIENNAILNIGAGDLDITNAIQNKGTIKLGAGTLAQAITGDNGLIITTGNVSSLANYLGNAVTNTTGNTLILTGGQLDKAISGGNVTISGDVTSNASIASAIGINSGKSLTINADNVDGAVTNAAGILNLNGGELTKTVNGAGTTNIKGAVTSTASIANAINIDSKKSLTIGADNVDGAVANAGTLNLGAGTLEKAISGSGTIVTTGDVETIASYLGNDVTNTGHTLTLTGDATTGILASNISDGNVTIGGIVNTNGKTVSSNITVNDGAKLTSNLANLTGTVENNGIFNMSATELTKNISGSGKTVLDTDTKLTANRTIAGILDMNGKTVDMQSTPTTKAEGFNTLTVGSISNSTAGNIKLDANMETASNDKINITSGVNNSGTLNLSAINVTAGHDKQAGRYYLTYLIGTTDGLTLAINGVTTGGSLSAATIDRTYTFTLSENKGNLDVVVSNTGVALKDFIEGMETPQYLSYSINENMNLDYTTAIGTTAGRTTPVTLNLFINNDAILNAKGTKEYDGITVADGYTLNISSNADHKGTIKNFDTALAVNNGGTLKVSDMNISNNTTGVSNSGTLTLNNVNFSGNTTDVSNAGTLKLTGENTFGSKLTGTTGTVTNSGTLNIGATNLDVALTNNNILNLGEGILGKAVTGTGSIITKADITSLASYLGNDVTNTGHTLTLTGNDTTGILSKAITGGDVTIDGDVISSSSIISDVTVNGSSTLEIAANQIGNTADGKTNIQTNNGTVILNGNVLSTALSGAVQIKSGATVQSNIANFIGTLENLGTYNMIGNIDRNINGTGTTVLQNDVTVTDGKTIYGTLNGNGKTIDMRTNPVAYETLTVGGLAETTNLKIDVNMVNKTGESSIATASDTINITGASQTGAVLNLTDITAYGINSVSPQYGTQDYPNYVTYATGAGASDINLTYQILGYEKGNENAKIVTTVLDDQSKPAREYTFTLSDDLGKLNVKAKDTTLTLEQFIDGSTNTTTNIYELASNYTTEKADAIGTTKLGTGRTEPSLTVKLHNGASVIAKTTETEGITVANNIILNVEGDSAEKQGKMTGFNTALKVNEGIGNVLNLKNMILTGNTTDIENNATLNLAGTNTIDIIIGTGTTEIIGGITTVNNTLTQDNLINNGELTVDASALNIVNGVTNNDTLVLNGGTLTTDITGGNVNISDKVKAVVNNAIINVSAIDIFNVEAPSKLENNSVIIAQKIDNAGILTANNNSYIKANIKGGTFNSNGNNTVVGSIQDNGDSNPATLNLNSGTLYMLGDLQATNTVANGGSLNLADGVYRTSNFGKLTLADNMNLLLDTNLATASIDQIKANEVLLENPDNRINMMLNMPSRIDTVITNPNIALNPIADGSDEALKGAITHNSQTVTTPIFNYTTNYDKETGLMNFVGGGGYEGFNPSVMAGAVAAQVGGYLNQLTSYDNAFEHMDAYMLMTKDQRTAMKMLNRYASAGANLGTYNPNQLADESRGIWFKPYATFEKVNLKGGPNVENTAYGSFVGGDSDLIELKNDWDVMYSAYASYDGSHQNYDGVSVYQNGGHLGATATWYKGNFFTGLTANVGASVAEASTMYGTDNMTMLMAGVASKTGYNWELLNSKLIVQPSLLMSYSFVNMFDYTNASGVAIDSDPLHAIQIAPGLKFIGNLPHGWQPYIGVQMVWNIMDETKFSAANVNLPQLSTRPYFQYGVGVQKKWGDRFSGYLQAMLRNGGRTGIALSAGFRWALGKDVKNPDFNKTSNSIPELPKTKIELSSANK